MKNNLTKCKACGGSVAKSAKQCPHCGAKMHQGVYAACAVIIVITIFAVFLVLVSAPSSGSPNDTPSEATVSVAATDLWQAYSDNVVSADNFYKDKLLSVTGTISDIGKDIAFDNPCVSLENGDAFNAYPIQCFFTNEAQTEQVAALRKGQTVTITGRCTGLPVVNVQMTDCYIAE